MKFNNKGFTMVELLAAITILGILMIVAIPSVQKVIDDSRKDVYLDNVIIQRNNIEKIINSEEYYVYDKETVYYFDYRLGESEKKSVSPYGEWVNCYVVVTFDGKNLHFYWTGIDEAGWKIDLKREVKDMTVKDIYNTDAKNVLPGNLIGGRDNVVIYTPDNGDDGEEREASNNMTSKEAEKCFSFKKLENDTYSITNYNTSCGTEVEVPSSIDGKIVSIIDENAFRSKGLTKVTLYYGIKELKNGAFQNNRISNLKLSSSITKIGPFAFRSNIIETLDLPEGLITIDSWAFGYNKIREVRFPKTLRTIGSYAFYGNLLEEIGLKSNATIGGCAFANNRMPASKAILYRTNSDGTTDYSTIVGYAGQERNLVIPESVEGVTLRTIGGSAFANSSLTSVSIPDTVTSIGGSAFYANNLKEIKFPSNLKTIGGSAFRSNFLRNIEIPKSVTSIGTSAFIYNCEPAGKDIIYARKSDGSIDYSTIVSGAGGRVNSAYGCSGNTNLVLPAVVNGVKLKTISSTAFQLSYYKTLKMPNLSETNGLTVGTNAFWGNSFTGNDAWIYKITNGKYDYSTLSSYAGAKNSGNIVIPGEKNGVKLKNINARMDWSNFSSIEVPSSVTSISNSVFYKSNENSVNLVKIINKSPNKFDWYRITGSYHSNPGAFVTGNVSHQSGDIQIVNK